MADFTEEIRRQSKGALTAAERQSVRYMVELFHVRGRFWGIFWKWVGYLGGGAGLAAAILAAWDKLPGGHP